MVIFIRMFYTDVRFYIYQKVTPIIMLYLKVVYVIFIRMFYIYYEIYFY